jgi:hypothetical protein
VFQESQMEQLIVTEEWASDEWIILDQLW